MEYQIVSTPYVLYETVELLYKFTNGISFASQLRPRLESDRDEDRALLLRQAQVLQSVCDTVCRHLDPQDPVLRHYFGRMELGARPEGTCLARLMTFSFLTLEETAFHGSLELIRRNWRQMQERGAWIERCSIMGLEFNREEPAPGDLLEQICALDLSDGDKLAMYRTLREFDRSLDELAGLMEPVALELERHFPQIGEILQERAGYWETAAVSPLEYAKATAGAELVIRPGDRTTVAFLAMDHNFLLFRQADLEPDENYLYLGFGAAVGRPKRDRALACEMFSQSLKALSDKKRLEILARLSKERIYSQELAHAMGMDPSNMSRALAQLCSHGFLRMEKEGQRNFYRTDPAAVRRFLRQLEQMLLDGY